MKNCIELPVADTGNERMSIHIEGGGRAALERAVGAELLASTYFGVSTDF